MRFSMSGRTQYLIVEPSSASAMDHGHAGAVAIEIEGRFGGGVLAANDDDILAPEGVRLGVVVRDVREILAGNSETVGQIVVAGGDDELLGGHTCGPDPFGVACVHAEIAVGAFDAGDRFAEAKLQLVVLDALAVILQGLGASGLFGGADQGQIADLQEFGRGEEDHVDG